MLVNHTGEILPDGIYVSTDAGRIIPVVIANGPLWLSGYEFDWYQGILVNVIRTFLTL